MGQAKSGLSQAAGSLNQVTILRRGGEFILETPQLLVGSNLQAFLGETGQFSKKQIRRPTTTMSYTIASKHFDSS